MAQDASIGLSRWLSNRIDSRMHARQAAELLTTPKEPMMTTTETIHTDSSECFRKEPHYLPRVCSAWFTRCSELNLKGKARERALEAYMQGALATATATGVMPMDRAQMIGFLCSVGRLESFVKEQAGKLSPSVEPLKP